eukprot:CAMPEP_0184331624 /NCGR_PEP_ID=MMETSP1089-20130417/913_1 /TAXON_ID=38269 ORGANISM="Gloeochaete wittrockiana, Strain SAG46.84" /NCGR_SAMPLE_ID=MMETSP1089 /ASSEMBLY_ACC=CAM_ASM_000445 /LENGTH=239 /DNA_ID=CAMNT_0026654627 /DNA_START=73 /DNA_END=792 /DNA_ORIENTATION=-
MIPIRFITRCGPALRIYSASPLAQVAPRCLFSKTQTALDKDAPEKTPEKQNTVNVDNANANSNENDGGRFRRPSRHQHQHQPRGDSCGQRGWPQFSDLENIITNIDRNIPRSMRNVLGNDFFEGIDKHFAPIAPRPNTDVIETDTHFLFQVELPGFSKADVKLEIKEDTLRLTGERSKETTVEEGTYKRVERSQGSFAREYPLPPNIDVSKVTASFENGLLEIKLPKAVTSPSQVITIN